MSSGLEDLNFKINADVRGAMDQIKDMGKGLEKIMKDAHQLDAVFRNMAASAGLPAKEVDLLLLRLQPLLNTLMKADKQATALETSFTRKLMAQALEDHAKKVIKLADGTERARYEMIRLADASMQVRPPTMSGNTGIARQPQGQGAGGVNFVRVAAVAAQLTLLGRVSATMSTMGSTIARVGETSKISAGYMDRFRMGLAAPKVNPEMNVIKNGIDKVGDSIANGINKVREMADAVASDIPGTMGATASALGKINVELDKASATASKHVSKMQSRSQGLTLLGNVFPFMKKQIQSIQQPFDELRQKVEAGANTLDAANAKVAAHANQLRNAQFIMDGTFQKLGGSADMFARAAFHANLPIMLMTREWGGATRVVRAAMHVWNFVSHPIHSVSMALEHSTAQFRNFRSQLPELNGGLQLGARAFRAFAHATYFTGPAVTIATKAVKGAAKGVWGLIWPVRTATTSLVRLTGVQDTFIGRALRMQPSANGAATAIGRMSSAANSAFRVGRIGVAGLAAGLLALGTSSALATEKNNAVFGTMLKDMDQGKALVKSLQNTEAVKLFDNQELLDSGRLIFKAGVAASGVAGKTNQLATIAAATSTELNDLSRIYMQGANAGSFGQDKINQLAERGIDIYHGLAAATGVSGGELKKMISDGKIGLTEMDAALAHMTEGNGIYAGSLANMANTTSGKMKQIKNNVSQALGEVMGVAIQILQPFGTAIVTLSESFKSAFLQFRAPIIYAATAVAWFFGNFISLGKFAFTSFALFSVSAFNDFIYFFTTTIPAYLTWFGQNWKQVFTDAGNLIVTVFANIAKNIGTAMRAIWDFIASGGTKKLSFAFVPLLDGFKSTVSQLPNIPDRAMTELEKSLTAQTEQLGSSLANNFDAMLAQASAQAAESTATLNDAANKAAGGDGAAAAASKKAAENKATFVRSAEGQSVVAQLMRGLKGDDKKRELKAAEAAAKDLRTIAREVQNGKPLKARAWA